MERSILEWSIRALLLIAGTGLVVITLRLRGASLLHRAWTGAMLAMLLLPAWTKWGPSVAAPVLPAAHERTTSVEIPMRAELPRRETSPAVMAERIPSVPAPPSATWQQLLTAVYLAGVAVMLVRLVRGTLQVRSIPRERCEPEGFVTSPRCAAPVTIGWLRPVVLLPEDWRTWPAAKLDAVLVHEREHVRRRDPLVQWLALLNRCVFWFHPLAWWLQRKLAALAEEACDTAVLARGHAAHDYARTLIEMARSINETGARLQWAGAVEFSTGNLARRIRRIMDAPQRPAVSRAKSLAAGCVCAVMLASFLACTPQRRALSEQERTDRARMMQRQQPRHFSDAEVSKAASSLTPAAARDLEADVKAHPEHADQLLELLDYYQSKNDLNALNALTLWFIEYRPGMRQNWSARPAWDRVWDQNGFERGRQLWTAQLKKSLDSPFVYMNAAEFLSGNDNPQAEQILLDGQRKFPNAAIHWEVFLARHYAWALTGQRGQLLEREMADLRNYESDAPAQDAYAQQVRQTLLASKDTELLTRTAEQLQANRPNLEFSRALVERVLSIDPASRFGHLQRYSLQQSAVQLRAKTDPGSLSDADRMVLLESQLNHQEAKARELLLLASHNAADPNYGTAIFLANITLGGSALNRGDKAAAIQYLLAASEAPPTEFLRYHKLDMSLAQALVEAGQRESVITFLDRCAKFNSESRQLAEWIIQLREGLSPRLAPPNRHA
jgi:beta-lactamase regulating signal transducer with metallopeptidase domain